MLFTFPYLLSILHKRTRPGKQVESGRGRVWVAAQIKRIDLIKLILVWVGMDPGWNRFRVRKGCF
ncbi:hypothetical protein Hanom_Chr13g01184611 [Helianthus anomalus]